MLGKTFLQKTKMDPVIENEPRYYMHMFSNTQKNKPSAAEQRVILEIFLS